MDNICPISGSAAATPAITAKAVVKPEAATETELGKNVVHIRTFAKRSYVDTFLKVLMLHHVL